MKNIDIKKIAIKVLPFALFFYLANKAGQAFRLSVGADISAKVLNLKGGFITAFANPLPSFHPQDVLVGIVGAALIFLALQVKRQNAKKWRKGAEYGSARWGTPQDIAPFIDPVFDRNILLTQTERLTMESRPKNPAHARSKNVLVIGGSGSGKTRFFIKPQLMQLHSSYVVTDPKGLVSKGQILQAGGQPVCGTDERRERRHFPHSQISPYNPRWKER
jgi:type IV secretion system protein VirD4